MGMSMPPLDPNVLRRMIPMAMRNRQAGSNVRMSAFSRPPAPAAIGAQPLTNSSIEPKDNLSLDVETKDWKVVPGDQPEQDRKIVDFVKTRI